MGTIYIDNVIGSYSGDKDINTWDELIKAITTAQSDISTEKAKMLHYSDYKLVATSGSCTGFSQSDIGTSIVGVGIEVALKAVAGSGIVETFTTRAWGQTLSAFDSVRKVGGIDNVMMWVNSGTIVTNTPTR